MKKTEIKYDLTIITVVDGKNEEYTMKTYNDLDTLVNEIDKFVDIIRITSEFRKKKTKNNIKRKKQTCYFRRNKT